MENNDLEEVKQDEIKCFWCKKMIPKKAFICPYCHSRTFKNIIIRLIIVLAPVLFFMWLIGIF